MDRRTRIDLRPRQSTTRHRPQAANIKHQFKLPKLPRQLKFIVAVAALAIIVAAAGMLLTNLIIKTADLTGLRQYVATNCTDGDGGKIDTEVGSCVDSAREDHQDSCVLAGIRSQLKLQEWFCENNSCKSETLNCQQGFSCVGGRCVKT